MFQEAANPLENDADNPILIGVTWAEDFSISPTQHQAIGQEQTGKGKLPRSKPSWVVPVVLQASIAGPLGSVRLTAGISSCVASIPKLESEEPAGELTQTAMADERSVWLN